jgi:dephospho-CoA kinase
MTTPLGAVKRRQRIPVIGLVGGIGAGKSFLGRALAEKKNIVIVNGDAAGHEVLGLESTKSQIRQRFGDQVFDNQGAIDRRALGRMVFGTGREERQARAALEQIVHPLIKQRLEQAIASAQSDPRVEAIILDAAILLEAGWRQICDALIYIDVPAAQRWERVSRTRGWSEAEFRSREASQLSLDSKLAAADYIIENSGAPEVAVEQFLTILSQIMDDLS